MIPTHTSKIRKISKTNYGINLVNLSWTRKGPFRQMPPKCKWAVRWLQEQALIKRLNISPFASKNYYERDIWTAGKQFMFKICNFKDFWNESSNTLQMIIWRRVERLQSCVEEWIVYSRCNQEVMLDCGFSPQFIKLFKFCNAKLMWCVLHKSILGYCVVLTATKQEFTSPRSVNVSSQTFPHIACLFNIYSEAAC
jgi:hypothetical protein